MVRARAIAVAAGLAVMATAIPAGADDVVVVSEVLPGTRAITSVGLPDLTGGDTTLDFSGIGTQSAAKLTIAPAVAEVNAPAPAGGDWSVKVRVCGPTGVNVGGSLPTGGSACGTDPDRLVLLTNTATKLDGSAFTISDRSVSQNLSGGTATAVSGTQDLDEQRDIFTVSGQNTGPYTGTYTSSADIGLNVPSAATTGVYVGYVVVTLVE